MNHTGSTTRIIEARDYDLEATLDSGQAFRWHRHGQNWIGVVGSYWTRLHSQGGTITAETAAPVSDWDWLFDYLNVNLDFDAVLRSFPNDEPMRAAVAILVVLGLPGGLGAQQPGAPNRKGSIERRLPSVHRNNGRRKQREKLSSSDRIRCPDRTGFTVQKNRIAQSGRR